MDNREKQKSKALISGTILYAIGNLGTKLLSFFIVPLYTYYIDTADMGDYDLVNTTISLLTPLLTLQISDAAYRWMIEKTEESDNYINAVYKFMLLSSVLSCAIILLVNVFVPIKYCGYMVVLLTVSRFYGVQQKLLRGLKNQKLFAASSIAYTAIFLLLNLFQIVVLKQGVVALFQSAIISSVICSVMLFIVEKRLRAFSIHQRSTKLVKEMLAFSIPLVPNQLNWWIINSSDRYIVKFFLGSAANGVYSIANKFPSLLQLIFNIFYSSWQDTVLVDNDKDSGEFYTKVFRLYYRLAFSLLVFLTPLTKLFIIISMDKSYHDAINYVGFLYLGSVFQAFSSFFGVGYLKSGKTKQAATTSIYGAIINAGINLLLVKTIGLYAAAVSTFIGFLAMFVIRVIQVSKVMKIKIDYKSFCLMFLLSLEVILLCIFTSTKLDIVILAVGVIYFCIINKTEVINILLSIKNKIKGKLSK